MLRAASFVRQLAVSQKARIIARSAQCTAVTRAFPSPNRVLRLQQFTTSSRNTTAEASISPNSGYSGDRGLELGPGWSLYEGEGLDGVLHGQGKQMSDDGK
eukprot:gene18642-21214_t